MPTKTPAKISKPAKTAAKKNASTQQLAAFQTLVRSYDEVVAALDKLQEEHSWIGERYVAMKDENARLLTQVDTLKGQAYGYKNLAEEMEREKERLENELVNTAVTYKQLSLLYTTEPSTKPWWRVW